MSGISRDDVELRSTGAYFGPRTELVETILWRVKGLTQHEIERLAESSVRYWGEGGPGSEIWEPLWEAVEKAHRDYAVEAAWEKSHEMFMVPVWCAPGEEAFRAVWCAVVACLASDLVGQCGLKQWHLSGLTHSWGEVIGCDPL